ncbi:hypothetical protein HDU87_000457 [Geranomyces variabilis]|uniref:Uncharacterized protein n=1 Tax=Geranomyces variabilis TaxID=109894 RepID=A0AAD5TTJ4_9FUNG|nr:hypothetical protein HDU87_000457 [Geranomyces variabilis]
MLTDTACAPSRDVYEEDVHIEDEEDDDSESMSMNWPVSEHPDVTIANISKTNAQLVAENNLSCWPMLGPTEWPQVFKQRTRELVRRTKIDKVGGPA